MELWIILATIIVGLIVLYQAIKHAWEEWYYGRLNRKTLDRWHRERLLEQAGERAIASREQWQRSL